MYTKIYGEYNRLKEEPIMSEKKTLEIILDNEFEGKLPKELKDITPEEWAKYAFKNNHYYVITYYKDNEPYVCVSNGFFHITYMYFTKKEGKLFNHLTISYEKGYNDEKTDEYIPYDKSEIFLCNIRIKGNLGKSLSFYSDRQKDNVFLDEFIEEDGKTYNIEQYGTADLSKHWFDGPKDYLDYERLIDYQALFDSMPTLSTKKK